MNTLSLLPKLVLGRNPLRALVLIAWLAVGSAATLRAVIFYSTADPTFNTTAPTGNLSGSGWQWVGYWDGFQGTPIGPHHFLTAQHIGGTVGHPFTYNGITFKTTAFYNDPTSDLRICEVDGTFPTWATLYRTSDEVGRSLVVFGRGLSRGDEVHDVATNTLRGWEWGGGGGVLRWGENAVTSVVNGGSWGSLLYATFDQNGGINEAALAVGDSSGPVFIDDGAGWKLAGIAAAVDGPFNTTNSGAGFNAAIFDVRGLYYNTSSGWAYASPAWPWPYHAGFYATQVSAHTAWIDGIVPPQDPNEGADAPLLSPAGLVMFAGLLFGVGARALRTPRQAMPVPR